VERGPRSAGRPGQHEMMDDAGCTSMMREPALATSVLRWPSLRWGRTGWMRDGEDRRSRARLLEGGRHEVDAGYVGEVGYVGLPALVRKCYVG
jgi:hypothetical protein